MSVDETTTLEVIEASEACDSALWAIASVQARVFESEPNRRPTDQRVREMRSRHGGVGDEGVESGQFVVMRADSGKVVATAESFGRWIATPSGRLRVLALAGVACLPEYRGQGLGRRVVEACFDRVDGRFFSVSLFQTGVASFYERLGARVVENRFVDSTAWDPEAAPWWNPQVMIYPGEAWWPEGRIDLLGPGW